MKNRKQLLADFYLDLLAIEDSKFNLDNHLLYDAMLIALSNELEESPSVIQRIFERMASEDVAPKRAVNPNYCPRCDNVFQSTADFKSHNCYRMG